MMMIRKLLNKNVEEELENRIVERQLQSEYEEREQWKLENNTPAGSIREIIHYKLINNRNGGDNVGENRMIVDNYLTEENLKFNELINRNLDYVPHPKLTLNEVYKLRDDNLPYSTIDSNNSQQKNLTLNRTLDDTEVVNLLNSIDDTTKYKIYQHLNNDMDHQKSSEHLNNFEKVELIIILLVKINFLLLKKSIPITKQIYHKFISNQLLLFNNNNFNKLLTYLIKFFNLINNNYDQSEINVLNLNEVEPYNTVNNNAGIMNKVMNIMPTINPMNIIGLSTENPNIISIAEDFVKQLQ